MMMVDPDKARVISALWFTKEDGTRLVMFRTSPLRNDVYRSGRGIGCTVVDAPCVSVHPNETLDNNEKYYKLFLQTGQTRTRTSLVRYILSQFNNIFYAGFLEGYKFQNGSKPTNLDYLDSDDKDKWIFTKTKTQGSKIVVTYRRLVDGEVT